MYRVLVIEDDKFICANILELLQMQQYEVQGAHNGQMGIQLAHDFHPDIILCDRIMEDMEGREVLLHLRSQSNTSNIPFIFLTAMADKDAIREGIAAGADDYIVKPFTSAELLQTITVWLDYRKSLRVVQ